VRLAPEVDVFRDRYKVEPTQTQAIPEAYLERTVGSELAARGAALQKTQAQITLPRSPEAGRQKLANCARRDAGPRTGPRPTNKGKRSGPPDSA